jgi:NAD(P)H-flavin reductase
MSPGAAALQPGDRVARGRSGAAGRCEMGGRDVVLVTGGLGCAPAVSVIHYVLRRRWRFGKLVIIQVQHADDLIWREQYTAG